MEDNQVVNKIQNEFEKYKMQFDDEGKAQFPDLFKVTSDNDGKVYVDGIYLGFNVQEYNEDFGSWVDPDIIILHINENKEISVGMDWPADQKTPFIDIVVQKEVIFFLDSNK